MCGRLSLTAADHRAAAKLLTDAVPGFELEGLTRWLEQAEYRPHYNVGPGQTHLTVRGRKHRPILDRALWGFRFPDKPKKLVINARAESVDTRPMFRRAFEHGRCLIPADGFFEWEKTESERLPWWFHRRDERALLFAAVLERPRGRGAELEGPPRFSIITVPAGDEVGQIHDRMPAIIESEEVDDWLFASPAQAHELLRPNEDALTRMRVSKRFNSVAYDEPFRAETP
jgi:putative SOS response-associated peptidase YedK